MQTWACTKCLKYVDSEIEIFINERETRFKHSDLGRRVALKEEGFEV